MWATRCDRNSTSDGADASLLVVTVIAQKLFYSRLMSQRLKNTTTGGLLLSNLTCIG